jgi:hypothetical protein
LSNKVLSNSFLLFNIINNIVAGKAAVACRAQERRTEVRTKSGTLKGGRKSEPTWEQRPEADFDIKNVKIYILGVGGKVLISVYIVENKRKERVFLSLTASQLTSRHLTTNPATIL